MSAFQYPPIAAPLIVAAGAETITVDKWIGGGSIPRRARPSLAAHVLAEVEFGFVVDVPVQSWLGAYPATLPRRKPPTFSAATSAPLFVSDVTQPAPTLAWQGRYPSRVFPVKRLHASAHPAWVSDKFTAPAAVAVPDGSWLPTIPALLFRKKSPTERQHVAPTHVPDVTQPVTAHSWRARYADTVWPLKGLPAHHQRAFATDPTTPTPIVVPAITPPLYPSQFWTTPRPTTHQAYGAPLSLADVTVQAPAMSWRPSYPAWVARSLYPSSQQPAHLWNPATIEGALFVTVMQTYLSDANEWHGLSGGDARGLA
jgi:hypothetical protein